MRLNSWFRKVFLFGFFFFLIDYGISELLLEGLYKHSGLNSNAEILINGSSMSLAGFNKNNIESSTHKSVAFYSRNGVSLEDRSIMLKHYFSIQNQKTKLTILEINPLLFSKRFTAANVYVLFLPFMDDNAINNFIKDKTSKDVFLLHKFIRTTRYNSDLVSVAIKGYLGIYENKKNQVLDTNSLNRLKKIENSVPVEFNIEKVAIFKKLIAQTQLNSANIILVNMPIYENKMKTFRKKDYDVFISFIKKFSEGNKNILFLDLNQAEITSHADFFSDPLHLNYQGQKKATSLLINKIITN
jgi:hypothetical protein